MEITRSLWLIESSPHAEKVTSRFNLSWWKKFIAACTQFPKIISKFSALEFSFFFRSIRTNRRKKPGVPKKIPKQAQLIRITKTSLTWSWILVFVISPFQYFMSICIQQVESTFWIGLSSLYGVFNSRLKTIKLLTLTACRNRTKYF